MKTPSPPLEAARSYLPRLVDPPASSGEKEEKLVPRYVELPMLRERGHGPRNLAWGVVTLLLALLFLAGAVFLAGPHAVFSLAICLLTFTALFVLARLHIFRQRNGGFLALGVVCLLGALFPLLERAYAALSQVSRQAALASTSAGTSLATAETEPPLLTRSFALGQPDAKSVTVKALKDSRILIAEKPFLIKTGDVFPLVEKSATEVSFAVRDLHLSLPLAAVEIHDPNAPEPPSAAVVATTTHSIPAAPGEKQPDVEAKAADPAEVTLSAQREAVRRYPSLGLKDSLENSLFVSTYKQLKSGGGTEFFSNPEWPIELAELLAKREHWTRDGQPLSTGPAPILDAPQSSDPAMPPAEASDDLPKIPAAE